MPSHFCRLTVYFAIAAGLLTLSGCFLLGWRVREPLTYRSVSTLAYDKELREPFGIATRDGEVYVSDGESGSIFKLGAEGQLQPVASGLNTPSAISFLPNGDLVVADTGSHTIKRVTPDGTVTILAGIENVAGSADGAASSATFNGPVGVATDDHENVYVADTYNDRIRVIERHGVVGTLAGSSRGFADGHRQTAKFHTPLGLVFQQDRLLVADSGNRRIRVVEPQGGVSTLAGSGEDDLRDG